MSPDLISEPRPLELSPEQMREMVDATLAHLTEFFKTLPAKPTRDVDWNPAVYSHLREDLPEHGTPLHEILEGFFGQLVPNCFNSVSPGFMAYIPGGGLFHAAIADLIADCVNRYVTVWAAAPGMAEIENRAIRWFCDMVGYPSSASGFLTSGGSLANFSALFTARKERLPENFLDGTIYVSDQVHHSISRAASLAGFPSNAVRVVEVDTEFRIRTDQLEVAIARDRNAGKKPFAIVASAGTTNTGAIDDLPALAAIAKREELWFHVDAAYGGFFMLTERGRQLMAGIESADSITLDPHKGLFLPYGTGCLLVRDGSCLGRAHAIEADYMPPMQSSADQVDFCNISPELSRDFRGLRVWLPLKLEGAGAFRFALDEKLDLTLWAHQELASIDNIRIVAEPQLSVVAFRYEPPGVSGRALDRLNENLLEQINQKQNVFLTGTMLEGNFALRICIVVFRTHLDRVRVCLEDIRAAIAETAELEAESDRAGSSS